MAARVDSCTSGAKLDEARRGAKAARERGKVRLSIGLCDPNYAN